MVERRVEVQGYVQRISWIFIHRSGQVSCAFSTCYLHAGKQSNGCPVLSGRDWRMCLWKNRMTLEKTLLYCLITQPKFQACLHTQNIRSNCHAVLLNKNRYSWSTEYLRKKFCHERKGQKNQKGTKLIRKKQCKIWKETSKIIVSNVLWEIRCCIHETKTRS